MEKGKHGTEDATVRNMRETDCETCLREHCSLELMAANAIENLCFFDDIMTAKTYINIINHNFKFNAHKLCLGSAFFF